VSSDQLHTSLEPGDNGLEIPAKSGAPMNIGEQVYDQLILCIHVECLVKCCCVDQACNWGWCGAPMNIGEELIAAQLILGTYI
jgi:hypothetical protein